MPLSEAIQVTLLLVLLQAGGVVAACQWVTKTTLLSELVNLAHKLKLGGPLWYPLEEGQESFRLYTREDWTRWSMTTPFPDLLGHLLNCPYCLSAHASFWLSLLLHAFYPSLTLAIAGWLAAAGVAMTVNSTPRR